MIDTHKIVLSLATIAFSNSNGGIVGRRPCSGRLSTSKRRVSVLWELGEVGSGQWEVVFGLAVCVWMS